RHPPLRATEPQPHVEHSSAVSFTRSCPLATIWLRLRRAGIFVFFVAMIVVIFVAKIFVAD
ncbi:MAG: hypothetical protein ACRD26_09940, partial [Vicinamibacterales bacterium]